MIRPAGKPVSRDISAIALNIDLAPTLLSLGDVPIPPQMQGQDLTCLWDTQSDKRWRTDFLYEHFLCDRPGRPDPSREDSIPSSEGVRNGRYTYLRYPYEMEDNEILFDRWNDPDQKENIIGSASRTLVRQLRRRTDELITTSM